MPTGPGERLSSFSFFTTTTEIAHLLTPLIAGLAWFGLMRFNSGAPTVKWVSGVIFFNLTHIVFTFKNIIFCDEYRTLFQQRRFSTSRHLAIVSALFLAFLLLGKQSSFHIGGGAALYFALICNCIQTIHSIRQSLGISLVYNQKILGLSHVDHVTLDREAQARRHEHWACLALCSAYSLKLTDSYLRLNSAEQYLLIPMYALFALSAYFYVKALLQFKTWRALVQKTLFLFRMIPWFLINATGFTMFVTQAVHRIEYLFVDGQIRNSSPSLKKVAAKALVFMTLFSGIFLYLAGGFRFAAFPGFNSDVSSKQIESIAICLGLAINFYHFYLDYWIFRMRSPENRRLIGPLLTGPQAR